MAERELDERIERFMTGGPYPEDRCRVCGWPLDPKGEMCRADSCSMRPPPERRADEPGAWSESAILEAALIERLMKDEMRVERATMPNGSYMTLVWNTKVTGDIGRAYGCSSPMATARAVAMWLKAKEEKGNG